MPITRSGKRQSRLDFTPLPSSSPQKQSQPEALRERAAAVTLNPAPNPRKRKRAVKDNSLPTPKTSSQDNGTQKSSANDQLSSEDSDDHAAPKTRSFMGKGRIRNQAPASSPLRKSPANADLIAMFSDSESDAPIPKPAISHSRRRNVVSTDEEDSNAGREAQPAVDLTGEERGNRTAEEDSDESDELPVIRRRRQSGPENPRERSREEEQDLEEDLEFLGSVSDTSPGPRIPSSAKKAAKQTALDVLKRKRGKAPSGQNESSIYIEGDPFQDQQELNETNGYDDFDADQPEDDGDQGDDHFIDEEEDEEGHDAISELLFTNKLRTMRLKELFKYAVEWMVQNRLNPAFETSSEVYRIAFSRLNDFVKGMGGSKFQSSAWGPTFLRSLRARPVLQEAQFAGIDLLHDRCDACNRSNHPATFEVVFSGSSYDKETLEEYSDDEEDDASLETPLPSAETRYHIGK